MSEAHDKLAACIDKHGLSLRSEFVPFSKSRNAAEKSPSLNWKVTLIKSGRDILTTDYMAGMAHCPSYKQGAKWTLDYRDAITFETEKGRRAVNRGSGVGFQKPIEPDPVDVIWSLMRDADVLDSGGFENWASELGYDTDSRKAEAIYHEAIYHECLELALKLRAGIGEQALSELRDAGQDY